MRTFTVEHARLPRRAGLPGEHLPAHEQYAARLRLAQSRQLTLLRLLVWVQTLGMIGFVASYVFRMWRVRASQALIR